MTTLDMLKLYSSQKVDRINKKSFNGSYCIFHI